MSKAVFGFLVGAIIVAMAAGWWYLAERSTVRTTNERPQTERQSDDDVPQPVQQAPGASIGDENLVEFRCDDGKSLTAVFTRDIVGITLSDGRQMELRQAESGSGIRYISLGGTIEFHGKGEGGFVQESGETTYANCETG